MSLAGNKLAGGNPKTERVENDFYATNPKALSAFLEKFGNDGERISEKVWEPCCGLGHLSDELIKRGYEVTSTDIINRGYGKQSGILDMVKNDGNVKFNGDILTNPPYKYAKEIILNSLNYVRNGDKVIMFLKCQFLEGQNRLEEIYKKYPPKYVYVHSQRQQCSKDARFEELKANTLCYCWYVWQKGFFGDTILRWI